MAWFDEIAHLFRRPMAEIGFVFFVREKMRNDLQLTADELRQILGPGWFSTVDNLRRSGIISLKLTDKVYKLSVVAPGDKKRARCRAIGRMNRSFSRLEKNILKDNTNEKND
jgi:hypothetical protein